MSTLREIAYSIMDQVRPNNMTNSDITEELVKFHIRNTRSQLALQQVGKYTTLSSHWKQSLGCLNVVQADASECCAVPTGCMILRTELEIPNPIDTCQSAITRVGPVNLTERPFQYIEFERVPFEGGNQYTKNLIKWFTVNDKNFIYLLVNKDNISLTGITKIQAEGIFDNPEDLTNFRTCSGDTCYSSESTYPIPNSLIPLLQEMVLKKFIIPQAQAPIDGSNDGKINPETTITKGS